MTEINATKKAETGQGLILNPKRGESRGRLVFDPLKHEYRVNGESIPFVTKILAFDDPLIAKYATTFHRDRGLAIHKAIKLLLADDLDEESLDPRIRPFIETFKRFILESGFKPILDLCETPQYDEDLWYAGTPDLIGFLNGRLVLIECKTATLGYADIQTSAYARFFNNPARFGLRLGADKYALKPFTNPADWNVFYNKLLKFKEAV